MRYLEIISERIVNRPHHLGTYVRNRIKDLERIAQMVEQAAALVSGKDEGERLLTRCARYAGHDDADFDRLTWLTRESYGGARQIDKYFPIYGLLHNLRAYLEYGRDFLRYVTGSFAHLNQLDESMRLSMAAVADIPQGLQEYGYQPGQDYSDDEEYREAMQVYEGLKLLVAAIQQSERVCADIRGKLGEVEKISGQGDRYRPDHGEIETLYHATAFCTEILRDGFAAEPPEGRRGLGNLGAQREISFTHSLEIAHTLARCLKEMWMIAHGQLSARQIVGWIRQEGMDEKKFASSLGLGVEVPATHPAMAAIGWTNSRIKTLDEIARDNNPEETAKMYRVYLAYTKLRNDPVFTYPEETMKMMRGRDIKDIGVLACEVRLEKGDEYKVGESEFRVMADRVYSTKRVF